MQTNRFFFSFLCTLSSRPSSRENFSPTQTNTRIFLSTNNFTKSAHPIGENTDKGENVCLTRKTARPCRSGLDTRSRKIPTHSDISPSFRSSAAARSSNRPAPLPRRRKCGRLSSGSVIIFKDKTDIRRASPSVRFYFSLKSTKSIILKVISWSPIRETAPRIVAFSENTLPFLCIFANFQPQSRFDSGTANEYNSGNG